VRWRVAFLMTFSVLGLWSTLRAQRPFREYQAIEYNDFPLPDDWKNPHDWTRARLHVPGVNRGFGSELNWTMDYPRSDRHLLQGIRRLTRIDGKSVEQVVDLDGTNDVFNWPAMYAVEVGHWYLPKAQAAQLREYLLRGGFLMVDDFHSTYEWEVFMQSMTQVFPDRQVVDIDKRDPIFHMIYDLDDRFQVPGAQYLRTGRTYERMRTVVRHTGEPFMTTKDGSWSRSATTWISGMPGSGRTIPAMTKNSQAWLSHRSELPGL